jgi:hypothetical protein
LVLKPVAVWGRRRATLRDCATATAPLCAASSRALDQKVFEDEFTLSALQRPAATHARYFAVNLSATVELQPERDRISPHNSDNGRTAEVALQTWAEDCDLGGRREAPEKRDRPEAPALVNLT